MEDFDKWINVPDIDSRLFLGYVYTPGLPAGFMIGGSGNRVGFYWSFSFTLLDGLRGIDDSSNPIETKEEHFMDMLFGAYVRTINNLFVDIGLGFYYTRLV